MYRTTDLSMIFSIAIIQFVDVAKTLKTTFHYLLHCPIFSDDRSNFLSNIRSIDENTLSGSDSRISETLLFGIYFFNDTKNTSMLNTTIDYILSTKRFYVPLTNSWFVLKYLCIENMSLKFYYVNVKLFRLIPYYIVGYFALSVRLLFRLSLFYPFCLLINVSQSKSLHKSPQTKYIQLFYQLFCNDFLTGILGMFRHISTWWL